MRNAVEAYFDEIPNLLCNQVNKLCFSNGWAIWGKGFGKLAILVILEIIGL